MTVREHVPGAVREYYDAYWSAPDQPRYDPADVLTAVLRANITPSSQCIDVGCGAGQTYAQFVDEQAAAYVGVDVSEAAVQIARSSGLRADRVDDATRLPFDGDAFDVAICIEVLEHLFSPDVAAAEILRVLRPGGKLIVSTPNAAYWRLRANAIFGRWNPHGDALSVEQPWRDPHVRFFTPSIMQRMLKHVGFSDVAVGAHGGCFLDHLTSRPTNFGVSSTYRTATSYLPSLLGLTIHAVAVK